MSEKHDRTGARTATDLERKYNFGKRFSEILGLIDDSRDHVDEVTSGLNDKIAKTSTELSRTTETITMHAERIGELESEVEMVLNPDGVGITVKKVETTTGYKFDSQGLQIGKSGEQMANKLDNTGMYVTRSGDEILTANHEGVNAVNLHAKEYLIVGSGDGRSRFEDYGSNRTGCFYIGV